jgi:short-subunit dehydrogenase
MNVMFWGTLWPTLAVLPEMIRRRSGSIVNITSIGGTISVPHLLPYCCAKFAAVALSQGLRTELSQHGISVTTVIPGLMRTGSHLNAQFKGKQESEYTWFGLSAMLPGLSKSAESAARGIISAVRRGEGEITIGMPAQIAARFEGLFPEATTELLTLARRVVMPTDGGINQVARGAEVQERLSSFSRKLFENFARFVDPSDKNQVRTAA